MMRNGSDQQVLGESRSGDGNLELQARTIDASGQGRPRMKQVSEHDISNQFPEDGQGDEPSIRTGNGVQPRAVPGTLGGG